MKRMLFFSFFFLVVIGVLVASPSIHAPEKCAPGDPYRIIIDSEEEIGSLSGGIFDEEENVIVYSEAFLYPLNDGKTEQPSVSITADERQIWILLLGVPSRLPPKQYTVTVSGEGKESSFSFEKQLVITSKEFLQEDIPLDKEMSELRSTPDPEKMKEARILLRIVNRYRSESMFCTENLRNPLPNARITSRFGDRRRYLYSDGGEARAIHFGVDLAEAEQTPVTTCARGKVVFSGPRIITGNTIIIEHLPGMYSLYYHLHGRRVDVDDFVESDTVIGTVGSTGLVTGPHLHWEVRIAGIPVSPFYLLEHNLLDKQEIISIISSNYSKGR